MKQQRDAVRLSSLDMFMFEHILSSRIWNMNRIKASGTITRDDGTFGKESENLYWLDVRRNSGTVDRLMVFADCDVPEGEVTVDGIVKAAYRKGVGVPSFIEAASVMPAQEGEQGLNKAYVEGVLKEDPVCREVPRKDGGKPDRTGPRYISSVILRTDKGPVPVVLWGSMAKKAAEELRAGDRLEAGGRMQSRRYCTKDGRRRTAYELSAASLKKVGDAAQDEAPEG